MILRPPLRPVLWPVLRSPLEAGYGSVVPADLSFLSTAGVTGSPASDWASSTGSVTLSQGTAANRPAVTAGVFGSSQGLTFDGTNDNLSVASKAIAQTGPATLSVVFKTPASISARGVIVSQSDTAVANDWWEFGIDSDSKLYVESNAAGTIHRVKGATVLEASTVYDAQLCWDETDFYLQVSATEENPLAIESAGAFAWMGRVAGTTAFTVGATVTSAGATRFFKGDLGALYFWNQDLTA